jgi:hypothetical protein
MVLLVAASAGATDRFARDPDQITIATTGRILKVDLKTRTLKMRGSDQTFPSIRNVSQNFTQMVQGLKQHIGVTLPGGITIALPGHKTPVKSAAETNNLDDYIVVVTRDTVIQDGSESIRLEDFKTGETISIHGVLSGSTVTATRIAKWF